MVYIKFLESENIIPCEVIPEKNIVTLKFPNSVVVDKSGFQVFLDEKGEYNIGEDFYFSFNTIYRNDDVTAKYNGYQLSNDRSVYKDNSQDNPENLTAEEKEEIKKQNRIFQINQEIFDLKNSIASTDYIFTKIYEQSLIGKYDLQYDIEQLHSGRQLLRDKINQLENDLKILLK